MFSRVDGRVDSGKKRARKFQSRDVRREKKPINKAGRWEIGGKD